MGQWVESISVNAPADEVFAYVSDFRNHAEWSGHGLQVTKDDDGPVQVGSTYSTVAQQFGTQREHSTITHLEPSTRFGWDSTGGLGVVHHEFVVRDDDDGSTLTRTAEFSKRAFLAKVLGFRINKDLPAALREDLTKIKAAVESSG